MRLRHRIQSGALAIPQWSELSSLQEEEEHLVLEQPFPELLIRDDLLETFYLWGQLPILDVLVEELIPTYDGKETFPLLTAALHQD